MSSQHVSNPANQPPVDPRRANGVTATRPKPAQGGSKAPPGRPGVPRKQGAPATPAKPKKKKSESWIDGITGVFSCCSKKEKTAPKGRRPMSKATAGKPVAKPYVKAVTKPAPPVKARPFGGAKSAESSSKSSVRAPRKPAAMALAKTMKPPRAKVADQKVSESQSSRKVVKKGPLKEKPKQETSTSASTRKMLVEKKAPSKVKPQTDSSKEIINSKRSKEVAASDSPTKTARFWPVEDAPSLKLVKPSGEEPVVKDKVKKSKKEKKEMVPDANEPLQSLHIDRFVTGKRHVFRWAYEESFPLEEETEEDGEDVKKPELNKVKPKPKQMKLEAAPEDDDDEPLEDYTFKKPPSPPKSEPKSEPKKVELKKAEPKKEEPKKVELKKTEPKNLEKKETKEMPEIPMIPKRKQGEVLCCSCCDCVGNQALLAQNKK